MKFTVLTTILLATTSLNASKFENFIKQGLENIIINDGNNSNSNEDSSGFNGNNFGNKDAETYNGPTSLSQKKLKKLTVYGPTNLDRVNIAGKLDVSGPLEANQVQINELKVAGPVNLNNAKVGFFNVQGPFEMRDSQVNGASTLYGPLKARGSKFTKGVTVYADKLRFENSSAQSLIVITQGKGKDDKGLSFDLGNNMKITIGGDDKNENQSGGPAVYLEEGSKILGNVEFKGKPGKVILRDGSKVQGNVINGKTVNE